MTRTILQRSAVTIAAGLVLSSLLSAQSAHELFQQALSKERAEGQLQEAITLYQRVVDAANTDHALAAKALLQMGRCYEQLRNAEARGAYERLIARYPDQTDVVAQAKARLALLARSSAPPAPAAMTVQPLSDIDSELLAVDPLGTKAIVMDYSKGQNIALYDFAKKQRRLLTDLDWTTWWVYFAVWSPDSRQVAFMQATWTADMSELRVMTLDGRSSTVYRNEGGLVHPVGWTPDGATLLIVVDRPDKTRAVGTLPAAGGRFMPLRSFTWSSNRGSGFRLSPDGRFVAYEEGEPGLRDIHVVSLDGRESYRITDHPADDFAPLWSPDSRHLAFTSSRSGTVSLWTIETKAGQPAGQPAKLMDGMQSTESVDWIERGIFVGQSTNTSDLYTVTVDPVEGRATDTPRQIPYLRTGRNFSPVWSPDGGRLAFISSSATEPNRRYVVVMTPDGERPHEFLIPTTTWYANPLSPYDLRWFGDGRGLGFSGFDARGGKAVFRLLLDTGEWDVVHLPVKASWTRIEWNRDGTAFYFVRHSWAEANAGIFERSVKGDSERLIYRVAEADSGIRSLQFSADRKWLAFKQDVGRDRLTVRLVVVDVGTGATRTVLENSTDTMDLHRTINLVSWSPAGDLLIWRPGTGESSAETLLAPVNGGALRSITIPTFDRNAPKLSPRPLAANWSPAGSSIVFVRESRSYKSLVIENPLAAVRRTTVSQ